MHIIKIILFYKYESPYQIMEEHYRVRCSLYTKKVMNTIQEKN